MKSFILLQILQIKLEFAPGGAKEHREDKNIESLPQQTLCNRLFLMALFVYRTQNQDSKS